MNIILVSECSGRALPETRRILDQFAERRGERVWQTPITNAGLKTLRNLLGRSARRNTAVACHWVRGSNRTELLWIVGNAQRFNGSGAVPTNWTKRDILRQSDENDWSSLWAVRILSCMAGLLHDLGKACDEFQQRLKKMRYERNAYRHEWISIRLLQAFVGDDSDEEWISRMGSDVGEYWDEALHSLTRDGIDDKPSGPFQSIHTPIARSLAWLIMTHHRLPVLPDSRDVSSALSKVPDNIEADWIELGPREKVDVAAYWQFEKGLPVSNGAWRKRMTALAREVEKHGVAELGKWAADPYVQHLSRMVLMLADHGYSSRSATGKFKGRGAQATLYANTKLVNGRRRLDQTLSEHLIGVMRLAHQSSRMLPFLSRELPRLARCRRLQRRAQNDKFAWQDKAGELAASCRGASRDHGAFVVNMASTGCGKTIANARIMYNLESPDNGFRCCFALGLRTLTQQTGKEYRRFLALDSTEVAIHTGGRSGRKLAEHYASKAEASGAESAGDLVDFGEHVLYDGNPDVFPSLRHVLESSKARSLITAPMLVCTVDHLISATESIRGGRQILPMLRLLGSDLVLDELDDYDIKDLPALTRLVFWAGMLGSRVLVSSATLPPSLVQGMFLAYQKGREIFTRNRGVLHEDQPRVCCMWVDEFSVHHSSCASEASFVAEHQKFVTDRVARLSSLPARRFAEIVPVGLSNGVLAKRVADTILSSSLSLHQAHSSPDPATLKRVSFGLVRMANIGPLYEVAMELYRQEIPKDTRIHLCVYHSRFPLLLRSAIEYRLDTTLMRKEPDAVFALDEIRRQLDGSDETNHLFVVLASPVAEVGRDHDYDWAIVEPSSMRSVIQLAGRVRRHRDGSCHIPNIHLLNENMRSLKGERVAFTRPGFEDGGEFALSSHSLSDLLAVQEVAPVSAAPRVLERAELAPAGSLVDLEHTRLRQQMLPPLDKKMSARQRRVLKERIPMGAYSCWRVPQAMQTGILQQKQRFRESSMEEGDFALLPDESGEDFNMVQFCNDICKGTQLFQNAKLERLDDSVCTGRGIGPWAEVDYMAALRSLAGELGMDLDECARKFGTFSLPENAQGWFFHPALGFLPRK
jgi:CRISPR-associated endonuclease/helicase Cas3